MANKENIPPNFDDDLDDAIEEWCTQQNDGDDRMVSPKKRSRPATKPMLPQKRQKIASEPICVSRQADHQTSIPKPAVIHRNPTDPSDVLSSGDFNYEHYIQRSNQNYEIIRLDNINLNLQKSMTASQNFFHTVLFTDQSLFNDVFEFEKFMAEKFINFSKKYVDNDFISLKQTLKLTNFNCKYLDLDLAEDISFSRFSELSSSETNALSDQIFEVKIYNFMYKKYQNLHFKAATVSNLNLAFKNLSIKDFSIKDLTTYHRYQPIIANEFNRIDFNYSLLNFENNLYWPLNHALCKMQRVGNTGNNEDHPISVEIERFEKLRNIFKTEAFKLAANNQYKTICPNMYQGSKNYRLLALMNTDSFIMLSKSEAHTTMLSNLEELNQKKTAENLKLSKSISKEEQWCKDKNIKTSWNTDPLDRDSTFDKMDDELDNLGLSSQAIMHNNHQNKLKKMQKMISCKDKYKKDKGKKQKNADQKQLLIKKMSSQMQSSSYRQEQEFEIEDNEPKSALSQENALLIHQNENIEISSKNLCSIFFPVLDYLTNSIVLIHQKLKDHRILGDAEVLNMPSCQKIPKLVTCLQIIAKYLSKIINQQIHNFYNDFHDVEIIEKSNVMYFNLLDYQKIYTKMLSLKTLLQNLFEFKFLSNLFTDNASIQSRDRAILNLASKFGKHDLFNINLSRVDHVYRHLEVDSLFLVDVNNLINLCYDRIMFYRNHLEYEARYLKVLDKVQLEGPRTGSRYYELDLGNFDGDELLGGYLL